MAPPKYTEYKQEFLNRWDCNLHLKERNQD